MLKRRSTLRSAKLAKKKSKQLSIRIVVGVCIFALCIALISFLSSIKALSIQHIEVQGNKVISEQDIELFITERISGKYWHLFSKKNIFLYPRSHIEVEMRTALSRVESIDISFDSLTSISVVMEERAQFALWCTSRLEGESVVLEDACYFLDEQGLIFSESPQFSGNVYTRYYGRIHTISSGPLLMQYMPQFEFEQVHTFISALAQFDIPIAHAYAYNDGDVELKTTSGSILFFTTRESTGETLENLTSLLEDATTVPNRAEFMSTVQYIDLRFGKKIFLKLSQ